MARKKFALAAALSELDMSTDDTAEFFGVDRRTVNRWLNEGATPTPKHVELVLRYMLATRITPQAFRQKSGVV